MSVEKKKIKVHSLGKITGFLILMSALSRVLGYVRSIVITTQYGQTFHTDAYNAAFLIPDFIYLILIGGAFSTAFIPVLGSYIERDREEDAWLVANTILNLVIIGVGLSILLAFFLAPWLVNNWLGVGYSPEAKSLTVTLTRIMLVQSFFMCLSGISQGICHVFQQFTLPAIGSLLYNIAIILIGVWMTPYIGIKGFAFGVVIGSFLNVVVQIPTLRAVGFRYRPVIAIYHPGVGEFVRLALPVILGLSVIYLNNFVTQNLGSQLAEGTVTVLNNANRLIQLPIGIIATSIATSFFPVLTQLVVRGDMQNFRRQLVKGINLNTFLLIPASVGLMVISEPLIRALFRQGKFTEANVQWTAFVLIFYCLGIIGYSQQQVLNRGFYAIRDTRTAVVINVAIILANVALSFVLVEVLGAAGLALAYSLAGLLSCFLLYRILQVKVTGLDSRGIIISFLKVLFASLVMGACVYMSMIWMESLLDISSKLGQIIELTGAVLVGVVVYGGMALLLRMPEVYEVIGRFKKRKAVANEDR